MTITFTFNLSGGQTVNAILNLNGPALDDPAETLMSLTKRINEGPDEFVTILGSTGEEILAGENMTIRRDQICSYTYTVTLT